MRARKVFGVEGRVGVVLERWGGRGEGGDGGMMMGEAGCCGWGEREGDRQTFEMTTRRRRPRAMRLRRGRTVGEQSHCDG